MAVTLTTYRQTAAQQLGPYAAGTATSGSSTTVVECTAWPFKTSLSVDALLADQYVLRPDAALASDKVRLIASAVSASGQYTVDLAYTNAPYSGGTGEAFEVHGVIEPWTVMNRLVNEALKRCFLVVEFTVTPVQDAVRHSLTTAASWLADPKWVYQVGYLESGESRANTNPFDRPVRGRAVQDGPAVYLEHPNWTFSPTSTIYVRAVKPAYHHCATSASFASLQDGLNAETDVAVPPAEWVAAGVVVEAWREYGHVLDERGDQRVLRDRAEAAAFFTQMARKYFTPPERTFVPLLNYGGPSPRAGALRRW